MKTRAQQTDSLTPNPNLDQEVINRAARLSAATLHEAAGQRGALPTAIKPIGKSTAISGPAFTVQLEPSDNFELHRAVYAAEPGQILVVATSGYFEAGYWGEILSTAAIERSLGGLVLDGCVRDGVALANQDFPVFARGFCIRGTTKHNDVGQLDSPIVIGEVVIEPGDLVLGDADGVVVIPRGAVSVALQKAEQRERDERVILQRVAAGARTLDELEIGK